MIDLPILVEYKISNKVKRSTPWSYISVMQYFERNMKEKCFKIIKTNSYRPLKYVWYLRLKKGDEALEISLRKSYIVCRSSPLIQNDACLVNTVRNNFTLQFSSWYTYNIANFEYSSFELWSEATSYHFLLSRKGFWEGSCRPTKNDKIFWTLPKWEKITNYEMVHISTFFKWKTSASP